MEKKINDPWSTKKVENDFTHPPIPRGKKMKPFRWHERRHVPIDRSLIRKHVNQRKYPQGILLAVSFQPDVEKFQTARNVRTLLDVAWIFLTYWKREEPEDEPNRCLSNGLEKKMPELRKGGSFTEHKIHAFVSRLCSCRAWKAFAPFLRRAFLFSPFFSSLLSIIANST